MQLILTVKPRCYISIAMYSIRHKRIMSHSGVCFLTILVQVELRCTSAHFSERADDWKPVGQLLLVLVMVLFQQCHVHFLSDLIPKW